MSTQFPRKPSHPHVALLGTRWQTEIGRCRPTRVTAVWVEWSHAFTVIVSLCCHWMGDVEIRSRNSGCGDSEVSLVSQDLPTPSGSSVVTRSVTPSGLSVVTGSVTPSGLSCYGICQLLQDYLVLQDVLTPSGLSGPTRSVFYIWIIWCYRICQQHQDYFTGSANT